MFQTPTSSDMITMMFGFLVCPKTGLEPGSPSTTRNTAATRALFAIHFVIYVSPFLFPSTRQNQMARHRALPGSPAFRIWRHCPRLLWVVIVKSDRPAELDQTETHQNIPVEDLLSRGRRIRPS